MPGEPAAPAMGQTVPSSGFGRHRRSHITLLQTFLSCMENRINDSSHGLSAIFNRFRCPQLSCLVHYSSRFAADSADK